MNLRFQLKKMIRSLQYRVAFLISSVCVCLALFLEVWKNRGVDRFAVVSASEAVCGYGLSYGWKIFSAIWPFLIVLACSTSYVSEKKNRCVSVILVRTNWKSYLRGKLAVSAIGSMSVVLIISFPYTAKEKLSTKSKKAAISRLLLFHCDLKSLSINLYFQCYQ